MKMPSIRLIVLLLVLGYCVQFVKDRESVAPSQRPPALATQLLAEAAKSGRRGDLKGAVALAGRVVKLDANNATAYLVRGAALRRMGDFPQALEDFDRAIRISPESADGYCQRALAHQQSRAEGSAEKAFADVGRAIELDRSIPLAYIVRGNAYSAQGEFVAAVADFSRTIQLDSRSYTGYGCRATAYANLKDFARARQDIEQAIALRPPRADMEQLTRLRDSLPDRPGSGVGRPSKQAQSRRRA